ncbi:FAD/NAD(P)-binding domain-containing protein [Pholiota conissans]|uniref:FAD/NAD(P)-binding domain-containing protein n=1 Tax=Pholiota conissans TaxID=109636 RepID=A0A9P6D3A3_9AGAR|nr:FAD/NAD(P)-binding domain-containing protein [Pholiota conissans]
MDTANQKLRVAIVGGGIGGLGLALALARFDTNSSIQVDIYEAAAKLTQVGAGITFWPRGWDVIKDLGLEDDLVAYMSPGQSLPSSNLPKLPFILKKSDQREGVEIPGFPFRGSSITFYRADIQTVFVKHIPSTTQIHLGKRLVSFTESGQGVELHFKDGETEICNVLVGADGVHSVIRKGLLAKMYKLDEEEAAMKARPVWSGTVIYRSMIESDIIRNQDPNHPCLTNPMIYFGKYKHLATYPISRGKFINVGALYTEIEKENTFLEGPAVEASTSDAVSSLFEKWSDEVQCITKNLKNPSKWAIEVVKPLDKYADNRVFLLGDAAHAMTPNLGIGAGQALEDGYLLAQVLNKSLQNGAFDSSKVAEIYNTIRTPFANFAAAASRSQGHRVDFLAPGFEDIEEGDSVPGERLEALLEEVNKGASWTWNTSIAADVERALDMV